MQPVTLIQLISAQATPNLLAAMALDPACIIHCCTPSMEKRGEALSRAYNAAGLKALVKTERLSRMPQVAETKALVEALVAEANQPVVLNFTGGTKLMSLGAFVAALQTKSRTLYVDTDDGVFVDGATAPGFADLFPDGDSSLSQVKRQLRVDTLAIANGCERVTGGEDWHPYADLAAQLLQDPKLEECCQALATKALAGFPRDFAKEVSARKELLRRPVPLPEAVRRSAVEAGMFDVRAGGCFIHSRHAGLLEKLRPEAKPWEYHCAFNAFDFPFAFLQGVWWEVAVMRHLDAQGIYRDLRWSVQAGSRISGGTDLQEDILGIDDVNLLYVSCKRGGHKAQLSRTIEDVNSSAQRIGGSFAHKILAVCLPPTGNHKSRLETRCAELNIRLLTRPDIQNALAQ